MDTRQTDGRHKVIVITGASAGIGAALARHLGAAGHAVALAARRGEALRTVARESGERTIAVVTDVTRRADVERLRDEALGVFGRVDVWVNNAGRGINRPVLELTDADFDEIMAVNVKSALYGMQAVVPHFMARGTGHVINVSSFLGRVPVATVRSAYNAAKAALNALTANLRMDLRARYPGIHVSLVMPGIVTTEFARNVLHAASGGPPTWAAETQTADEVAAIIADVIANPVAERYTNPGSAAAALRYFEDVDAFEEERARRFRGAGAPAAAPAQ